MRAIFVILLIFMFVGCASSPKKTSPAFVKQDSKKGDEVYAKIDKDEQGYHFSEIGYNFRDLNNETWIDLYSGQIIISKKESACTSSYSSSKKIPGCEENEAHFVIKKINYPSYIIGSILTAGIGLIFIDEASYYGIDINRLARAREEATARFERESGISLSEVRSKITAINFRRKGVVHQLNNIRNQPVDFKVNLKINDETGFNSPAVRDRLEKIVVATRSSKAITESELKPNNFYSIPDFLSGADSFIDSFKHNLQYQFDNPPVYCHVGHSAISVNFNCPKKLDVSTRVINASATITKMLIEKIVPHNLTATNESVSVFIKDRKVFFTNRTGKHILIDSYSFYYGDNIQTRSDTSVELAPNATTTQGIPLDNMPLRWSSLKRTIEAGGKGNSPIRFGLAARYRISGQDSYKSVHAEKWIRPSNSSFIFEFSLPIYGLPTQPIPSPLLITGIPGV